MDAHAAPLRALDDHLEYFVRDRTIELAVVECSPELRRHVLTLIASKELSANASAPFFVLEQARGHRSPGWMERVAALQEQHEHRRRVFAEAGEHLPPLVPAVAGENDLHTFAEQVTQLAMARADWHAEVIIVLAPANIEDGNTWVAELRNLMSGYDVARWIVVEPQPAHTVALARELGPHADHWRAIVDEGAALEQLRRLLDRAKAGSEGPASVGAAGPVGVKPPPKPGIVSTTSWPNTEALASAGLPPLAGLAGRQLAFSVLGGALALREGDADAAIEQQRQARDVCVQANQHREAALMSLVLGSYLVSAKATHEAAGEYHSVIDYARFYGLHELGAQAWLGLATVYHLEGRPEDAAASYEGAAASAEQAELPLLAIESHRLAGQARLDLGQQDAAVRSLIRALELAEADPDMGRQSSAPEAAMALAAHCRRHGLSTQAQALEAAVERLTGASPREVDHAR